jgi:chloramphenicol 3-O-phosphotransferase
LRRLLVLEGVTGAGKSSLLGALGPRLPHGAQLVPEDDTLGDLMDQVRDPAWRAHPHFDALERVLDQVEHALAADPERTFLIERFHLTGYALFPTWSLLDEFDRRLSARNAALVLLTVPEASIEARSILRPEREDWAKGMDEWYGSRDEAVEAARVSQRRRVEALSKTRLPFLHLDTRERDWGRLARTVCAFWGEAGTS